jgi:hypothetical protein
MIATRRLAAILAADVAGYSRLMGADEEGTHIPGSSPGAKTTGEWQAMDNFAAGSPSE